MFFWGMGRDREIQGMFAEADVTGSIDQGGYGVKRGLEVWLRQLEQPSFHHLG